MQYMITRAALLLRAYPTTLEQDQETLKDSKVVITHTLPTPYHYVPQDTVSLLICQLRLCEKRILVSTVAYCEQMLKQLQAE